VAQQGSAPSTASVFDARKPCRTHCYIVFRVLYGNRLAAKISTEPRGFYLAQSAGKKGLARPYASRINPSYMKRATTLLDVTYKQERGPAATPFSLYAKRILAEFRTLLDTDPLESAVQEFLERHPSLVPGAWTPGTKSGHTPFYNSLITQPKLHGFDARIPDFLWISRHSSSIYAAMVEI
jgi:hypothetical protein